MLTLWLNNETAASMQTCSVWVCAGRSCALFALL